MSKSVYRWTGLTVATFVGSMLFFSAEIQAQEEEEGPGNRVMTVTTFDLPIQDRSTVFPFMVRRVFPAAQLNPKVVNYRVMFHNWGGNASQVVIVSEDATITDIEAPCGQPCEDYFNDNPAPEEGEDGYEEFRAAQKRFQELYSHHRDEIYTSPMGLAKVEGELLGPVGGSDPEPSEGGEGR